MKCKCIVKSYLLDVNKNSGIRLLKLKGFIDCFLSFPIDFEKGFECFINSKN